MKITNAFIIIGFLIIILLNVLLLVADSQKTEEKIDSALSAYFNNNEFYIYED